MSKNLSNGITIKVDKDVKIKLDVLKSKGRFKSFNHAIDNMCEFFELNKISPKDGLNKGFQNSISDMKRNIKELEKTLLNDSQTMRKLLRAIEKDHLISTSRKTGYLYEREKGKEIVEIKEKEFNSLLNPQSEKNNEIVNNDEEKNREIDILKGLLGDSKKEVLELKKTIKNEDYNSNKYEESLKTIYLNYQVEKGILGKEKIFIDMNKDDFEKLFSI